MNPKHTTDPSRRDVAKVAALLGGGLLAARVVHAIGPGRPHAPEGADSIFASEYALDNPTSIAAGTCLGCHGACPIRVSREGGLAAKVDGSPWSPRTWGGRVPANPEEAARIRGASCARGQARPLLVSDPYRLVLPLEREGERGMGRWHTVTPERIRAAIRDVLKDPSDLVVAVDPRQVDRVAVLAAFAAATRVVEVHLGTPFPWLVQASAWLLGGPGQVLAPRWERATAVLAWGADPLGSGVDPVGDMRRIVGSRSRRDGASLVAVDPRLSETAAKADVWLPVRPGGDRALAFLLMRAWQEEGVVSLPEHWARAVGDRPLADLERRAGVGMDLVRDAAELLAEAGPGLAIRVGGGVGERMGGEEAAEAILRLGVLRGAAGPGGAMEPAELPPPTGVRPTEALRRLLSTGRIPVLVVAGDGGIPDAPGHGELLRALRDSVDLLVVVTTAMNPVAHLADLVVPDVTELEREGLVARWDGFSLTRRVVEPPIEGGLEALLVEIAGVLGASLDPAATVAAAIDATGRADPLRNTGWAPARPPSRAFAPSPFREDAPADPGDPVDGLPLVTWRESIGGFSESGALYWALPSVRDTNRAAVHPDTAKELGIAPEGRLRLVVPGGEVVVPVHRTEGIRPGVVGVALGYGHSAGFTGTDVIDGEPVPRDRRRYPGVCTGEVRTEAGTVVAEAVGPENAQTLLEMLVGWGGTTERL